MDPAMSNRLDPRTRLVIRIGGSVPLVTTSGRNGTAGSAASADRTLISCRTNRAARSDQANRTKNSSPRGAFIECQTGVSWRVTSGRATGSPLSSGATARSAAATAAGVGSGSQLTDGPPR
jgi:hypothetical protein